MSEETEQKTVKPTPIGTTLLESAIEALIFAAEDPISVAVLSETYAEATGGAQPSEEDVESTISRLNGIYESSGRSFKIEKWGGGYRFATRSDLASFVKALFVTDRQRKLSRTLMESLAILAYRQPTTRSEIEFVRGVDSDYAVRKLLEYGLIDVVGRAESVGRPLLYGTTDRFLELFGLPELSDLPNLREMESILDDPAFLKEKARMLMTTAVQLPLSADIMDESEKADPHSTDSLEEGFEQEDHEETEDGQT